MLSSPPNPAELRREILPSTQLEELFFHTIVRLATCAHFLALHVAKDPDLALPETARRMRLLLTVESRLRVAYEEFRRLKTARQLQLEDAAQASRPLLAVVASHTSRSGFRSQPKTARPEITAAAPRALAASNAPKEPGRNSLCPCNSGRKYKHCCLNKPAPQAA